MSQKRVLIQAGHVKPREPGFGGGTGTAGEATFAHAVQHYLVPFLRRDGHFEVTHAHGDLPDGWHGELFLALHADGSGNAGAKGYSFGYPTGDERRGTSVRFARLLAEEYERIPGAPRHRSDNYTAALRQYYGWYRVRAPACVLVEHGFMTNRDERAWLEASERLIAQAHYRAICRYFGLAPLIDSYKRGGKPVLVRVDTVPVRVDIEAGNVRLRGQNIAKPAVRERIARLAKRFGRVLIRRRTI